jgi:two-component system cell cycle sensor histidine kinase/response regulator CckA
MKRGEAEAAVSEEKGPSLVESIKTYASRLRQSPAPSPRRVLIVDDEETVRRFVDRVLQRAGYETVTAGGGLEALELASARGPFDLLLTDVMMPEMTGDELARRLRQQEPRLKVLYLTGYSDQLFKEKVTLWEDEAFLDKPCSVNGLVQAVSLLSSGTIDSGGRGA